MSGKPTERRLKAKSDAIAYRVWAVCEPVGWDITVREIANKLGEPVQRINRVLFLRGWTGRVRSMRMDYQYHVGGSKSLRFNQDVEDQIRTALGER